MRLLILGATGRTGRLLVEEALKQGYLVNVLVRDQQQYFFPSVYLSVFVGLPTDKVDLAGAMLGCDAVISALNISRVSNFPWAKRRTPKDFLSNTIKNVIDIAGLQNINRMITVSAWGVSETKKELPFWFRWLIDYSHISYGYMEHEAQERLLSDSGLNWTAVRPVILTNSKSESQIKVSYHQSPPPGLFISRFNVAKFIIAILEDQRYYHKQPTISER